MKKVCALGLSLALLFSLAGCMADPTVETPTPGSTVSTASTPGPTLPSFPDTGMRIALCTSPGSVDDHSRNAACYNGVLSFIVSRSGLDSVTPLLESTGDSATILQAFGGAASSYDVMVCVGPAFSGFADVARANPTKYFILVDQPLANADGGAEELNNVYTMEFADHECGFYAGVTAAMETKTGRVAVIGDTPNASGIRYYFGFRSGVAYANGNLGASAEVIDHPDYAGTAADGTYIGGNFTGGSPSAAHSLTLSLADEGCDVLLAATPISGSGVFAAARERDGIKVIGAESDQFFEGANGETNTVLTSVTKDYDDSIFNLLKSIADGTFQGGSHVLSAKEDATGYVSAAGRHQLSAETLSALEAIVPMMKDGTIVPGSGPQ